MLVGKIIFLQCLLSALANLMERAELFLNIISDLSCRTLKILEHVSAEKIFLLSGFNTRKMYKSLFSGSLSAFLTGLPDNYLNATVTEVNTTELALVCHAKSPDTVMFPSQAEQGREE